MKPTDNINTLKNVGEARERTLNEMGIFTVGDLLYHFPKNYKDRTNITPIRLVEPETTVNIRAVVKKVDLITRGQFKITIVRVKDHTGEMSCLWFNQPYIKNTFKFGQPYIFTGKAAMSQNQMVLNSPDYELEAELTDNILPIYKTKVGQKVTRKLMKQALEAAVIESIPDKIRAHFELGLVKDALKKIHFPTSQEEMKESKRHLAIEELLVLQTALFSIKGKIKKPTSHLKMATLDISPILNTLPFELTQAQRTVLEESLMDLASGQVMYRLVQGDVGSGKTIIAVILAYVMAKNGYQVGVMVPTEILAVQHQASFSELLAPLGISVTLLTSKIKQKKQVLKDIAEGTAQVIVGTHALISKTAIFHRLGLVVTDEQHRFGVNQRASLVAKGNSPHSLVMSATPIPRTLALILYGDLDISVIDQMPAGRQVIDTYGVGKGYRERIWDFIEKEAVNGHQSYIVCGAIEENEQLMSVSEYMRDLEDYYARKGSVLKDKVGLIHGKMKEEKKQDMMAQFKAGELMVLVATTVIEVGINVPTATVMLIEDAHRFGLSQLHQLRGRVGRGAYKSYCILVSDSKGKVTKARLQAMTDHAGGFDIANLDLELRGPGDFFGTAQHGVLELKVANLYDDIEVIKPIQKYAKVICERLDYYPALADKVGKYILKVTV